MRQYPQLVVALGELMRPLNIMDLDCSEMVSYVLLFIQNYFLTHTVGRPFQNLVCTRE